MYRSIQRQYNVANVSVPGVDAQPSEVTVNGFPSFWNREATIEQKTLVVRVGDKLVGQYEYPGLFPAGPFPLAKTVTNAVALGEVIAEAHNSALLDEEDNVITLPARVDIERERPINSLAPFTQKIAERLPAGASLQVLTPTSANLVERTNIFDYIAFELDKPEEALKFYASLMALQTSAFVQDADKTRLRVAPFSFAVLEKTSASRERFALVTRREHKGAAVLAVPQGIESHKALAFFSLLTIEDDKGVFHHIPTGLWYRSPGENWSEAYGAGEDAVRYALSLLVTTIMRPSDILYTHLITRSTTADSVGRQFERWLTRHPGNWNAWIRRGESILPHDAAASSSSSPEVSPPRSPALRPIFRPDVRIPSAPLVSLSTRALETTLEVGDTIAAEQRVALCPLPLLKPGKTIDDLYKEYLEELKNRPGKQTAMDPRALRVDFLGQWLRSKRHEERTRRIIIKREQRKKMAPGTAKKEEAL